MAYYHYVPIALKEDHLTRLMYAEARAFHALMLRCEGLAFEEIGHRIESMQSYSTGYEYITKEQARSLVFRAGLRLNHAIRKAVFRYINPPNNYVDGFDPLA